MEYLILILSGLLGGLIAGLLGLGGGIFYILILPYIMDWYGIPSNEASSYVVANSLIGIAFASGVSIFTQFKKLKKYYLEIVYIAIPAVLFSLLATGYIVHSSWFSKEVFNIFVVLLMLFILFQMQFKNKNKASNGQKEPNIKPNEGALSGSISGFISALSGLGGGIIIIPILQIKLKQSIQKAKLISLAIIFISATFISIQNLLSTPLIQYSEINMVGFIIPSIAIPLILGVLIGGPIGVKWSSKMSDKTLNQLFIAFVLIVLIEKLLSLI
jgi:uncharacterized membrane protein YfcA